MIGIIILISLLICALCLLIALLYIRQTEIEVKDKSVDLESVLPIQTITENAVINGNGDITVGYRLLLPEVFTLSESEAQYIHERLEALLKLLPAGTVNTTYVFEDSFNGLKAGMASGATVIGLATTNSREDIAPLCHYVLDDFQGFTYDKLTQLHK